MLPTAAPRSASGVPAGAARIPAGGDEVIQFLVDGGPVMIPIVLASVVGLAVFLERLFALRASRVAPQPLRVELVELARQGRFADAITLCRSRPMPLTRVLEVAFLHEGRPRDEIKELTEEVGRREAALLERYTGVVGVVAAVSPLMGLMGTVWGMILTFEVIQEQGMGVVSSLAGGISQALITTFAGLTVAIPALIGHRYLLARVDHLVLVLEETTSQVLDLVKAGARPAGRRS